MLALEAQSPFGAVELFSLVVPLGALIAPKNLFLMGRFSRFGMKLRKEVEEVGEVGESRVESP